MNFQRTRFSMKRFLDSLYMATKDNETVTSFLLLPQNYVGKLKDIRKFPDDPLAGQDGYKKIERRKDCLYLTLLYALRYAKTSECSHTNDFTCLDQDMFEELEGIKEQIQFDCINPRFEDKLL